MQTGSKRPSERETLQIVLSFLKHKKFIDDADAKKLRAWALDVLAKARTIENFEKGFVAELKPGTAKTGRMVYDEVWANANFYSDHAVTYRLYNGSKTKTVYVSLVVQEVRDG